MQSHIMHTFTADNKVNVRKLDNLVNDIELKMATIETVANTDTIIL